MSLNDASPHKHEGHERRIEGPIPEYNKFGEYTGVTYFRCKRCDAESLRRVDLFGCCDA